MAIIHYDVTFEKDPPNLEIIKKRIEERTGLRVDLSRDSIEVRHDWPHIGAVRASGTLECDEVDGADLEVTVGSQGVRVTWVAPSTHPYFRDSAIGALVATIGGCFLLEIILARPNPLEIMRGFQPTLPPGAA